MPISRRNLLLAGGGAAVVTAAAGSIALKGTSPTKVANLSHPVIGSVDSWEQIRSLFDLAADKVDLSAMLISSHPKPVRDAIERHRRNMDANPVEYLEKNNDELTRQVLHAAGRYVGVDPTHVALTDSTTMGVGLVYSGFRLRSGDDILTTEHDYYVTHESLRLLAERSGAQIRKISLFQSGILGDDEAVSRIIDSILPKTRLVALTWVHSSTGWKIPVPAIANAVREINSKRDDHDQVLIGLDGVHGFGVEDTSFEELGCDFLMTGCHKWLFGPRGTGIIVFSERGLRAVQPSIPTFDDSAVFGAWLEGRAQPAGQNIGARMTPGGFKAFEHRWALKEAFELHEHIGKSRIARRTHELASRLKEGLSSINGVVLRTPFDSRSSAGIVSFNVDGIDPRQAVSALRERGVIASVAPYATSYVRLTPSIRNTNEELDKVLNVIGQVA